MLYTKEKIEELQHRWTTPHGKKILKKIKETRCYLSPVLYRKNVQNFPAINDEEVKEEIDLRGAPLAGFDFRILVQEDDEGFSEELAIVSNIHFEGANLRHSDFEGGKIHDCFFENADLSHSQFAKATLTNCLFQESVCVGANFQTARIIGCNFNDATIKEMSLDHTILDPKTTFGTLLHSEKEGNFHFASIEYKQIKEAYKNSSLHSIADRFHYREMVAKRKITSIFSPLRWLNYIFGDLLCKYGTSYLRVFLWSLGLVVLCAILYTTNSSLYFYNQYVHPSFFDSFYFSLSTFTTLGYGDFHAVGIMRQIAAIESFLGAALMSLFTVIIARTIIRD